MNPTPTAATPTATQPSKASTWKLDPVHSSAGFSVKHMMIAKVHGSFHKLDATLRLDRAHLANSSVEATIDASTIDTREPKRDEHLRSPDFFDVAKFPTIGFKSTRFEGSGDTFRIVGDLTLHGVTREVTLDVEGSLDGVKDPYGNVKVGASATTKINRKEFGLAWNAALETGGVLVGETVSITLELQFVKQ